MPLTERSPTAPANPYGHTKLMVEQILHDVARSSPDWRTMCLRYFNPVGAHGSGMDRGQREAATAERRI